MDVSPRTSPPALATAEVVAPTNRRQLMTTAAIVAVLILTLDLVAAALLAWRPVARDHWLVASKWRLLDRARATDTLVLGDSSCNQGVRPDVLGAALGGSVLNLCTIGDLLVINDVWMLEAYLRRNPPPARVVVVHTHETWGRSDTQRLTELLGHFPLRFGFWRDFEVALDVAPRDLARLAASRWMLLDAVAGSVRAWLLAPWHVVAGRHQLDARGFMAVHDPAPRQVRDDAAAHRATLGPAFAPSAINDLALRALARTTAAHRIELFVAVAPLFDGLWADPAMQRRHHELLAWLTEAVAEVPGATVIDGPPATFAADEMDRADHVTAGAAASFSLWLADRITGRTHGAR
ncbi:MAG TPA: hypothetical protein VM734_19735 [Kofleriaceae bacterium]|nr:hypothetical protein [Kofleriaceae bacterium]